MEYTIHHPVNGVQNILCARRLHNYEEITKVQADTLEEAYRLCQNDYNPEYAKLGRRDTSVGDVITAVGNPPYMISGLGFEQLREKWNTSCLRYINR